MAGDPYWGNVIFASRMDGYAGSYCSDLTGRHTISTQGVTATVTPPYAGRTTALRVGNGITATTNCEDSFGGGDFTVECWLRVDAAANQCAVTGLESTACWQIWLDASNIYFTMSSNGSTWDISNFVAIKTSYAINTWYYVAVSKNGSTLRCYANGVLGSSSTPGAGCNRISTISNAATMAIGHYNNSYTMNGYMADLRITKGVGRYPTTGPNPTESFSGPPTVSGTVLDSVGNPAKRTVRVYRSSDGKLASETSSDAAGVYTANALDGTEHYAIAFAGDPGYNNGTGSPPGRVVYLNHCNGVNNGTVFTEETGITPCSFGGNAKTVTNQSVFGGSSIYLDGTGDWIGSAGAAAANLSVYAGDFTIEFRFRLAAVPSDKALFYLWSTPGQSLMAQIPAGGNILLYASSTGVSGDIANNVSAYSPTLVANRWYAFALVRCGGYFGLYIDGYLSSGGMGNGKRVLDATYFVIGRDINMWVDEIRFVQGKAMYTTASYPVATVPFSGGSSKGVENAAIYDKIIPV